MQLSSVTALCRSVFNPNHQQHRDRSSFTTRSIDGSAISSRITKTAVESEKESYDTQYMDTVATNRLYYLFRKSSQIFSKTQSSLQHGISTQQNNHHITFYCTLIFFFFLAQQKSVIFPSINHLPSTPPPTGSQFRSHNQAPRQSPPAICMPAGPPPPCLSGAHHNPSPSFACCPHSMT